MNELLEQIEKWLQEAQEEADETIYDSEERFHLGEVGALTRVFALVRVLASQQKMDRRKIMKQWDSWRKYIAEGGGGSWPTDAFESLLDSYDEKIKSLEHRLSVKSVDGNIHTETPGAGSIADEKHTFSREE